jgi:tetratricopeptide (TPR) repeat protein
VATLPTGDLDPASPREWLDAVKDAERRGELLLAVDLAGRGLDEHPDDLWLRHRAVLCLARSGSTGEAAARFERYGLAQLEAHEDVAALAARIAKDRALAAAGPSRRARAARAADAYQAVFARTRGYYPAVNAATLRLVAGECEQARTLAREALGAVDRAGEDSYYAAATEAEARLLLGDEPAATAALERAAALADGDHAALATTRRQLRMVCELTGAATETLAALAGPMVAHYCGHLIAAAGERGRFVAGDEAEVGARIEAEVACHPIHYAYGSLAGGGDILWAEALLAAGCDLHVVLPFDRAEFVQSSVAPSGARWVQRFERCLAAAREVRYATDDAFLDDDVLYRYGAELAMGLALLRARYLDAEVRQLALWDGGPARGEAGTAIDVERWRRSGRALSIVTPRTGTETAGPPVQAAGERSSARRRRVIRALLFADVRGFSKLSDEQLPRFSERVLGALATALAPYDELIEHRNTWGDALYLVLDDVSEAAACALDLQAAMAAVDLPEAGLPGHLALRMGAHLGPVFPTRDPLLDRPSFMGSHVSRTARIEPVTPPGVVYVSGEFAAALALHDEQRFACDYVGHMPAAKNYGRLRMYRLRHRDRPCER